MAPDVRPAARAWVLGAGTREPSAGLPLQYPKGGIYFGLRVGIWEPLWGLSTHHKPAWTFSEKGSLVDNCRLDMGAISGSMLAWEGST